MIIQTNLSRLNAQYRKVKEDAKKLMLRGDVRKYIEKLIQINMIENEYRNALSRQMKAAA